MLNEMAVDLELDRMLRSAIENKQLIRFTYKSNERIVEPHDYGVQKGIPRLLSWQIGGQSSGRLPGWRWFDVEGLQDCKVLDKHFAGNREVPTGKHHNWDEVFIRVAPPTK
ncbi:MAG: WYL domain-containing protein [Candidatus Sulfotelmatobacter sp.]